MPISEEFSRSRRVLCSAVLAALLVLVSPAATLHAQAPPPPDSATCAAGDRGPTAPSRALYCIDLVPVPELRGASGVAELISAPTPFDVAVTAAGVPRYRVAVRLRDLPPPSSLGSYTSYIAWAATPSFARVVKLGAVDPGERVVLGTIAMGAFRLFVSAEPSPDVTERTGPLVLRGNSPTIGVRGNHFIGIAAGGAGGMVMGGGEAAHAHGGGDGEWRMPPMRPLLGMVMPGMDGRAPDVTPYLPGRGHDSAKGDHHIPSARPRTVARLADGDTLRLVAGRVRRTINGRTFVMYGFNGQYPGPLIRVDEGSEITVLFTNRLGVPTTVHWHGIRIENRYDGVPGLTQEPVPPGGHFVYEVRFPDPGVYWYHPHVRSDIQQDLGLYGNMLVESPEPDYYGPANEREVLMLDDILIDEQGLFPYGRERATHALMGRFGNVMLVNGEPGYHLEVKRGAVVRFFLTNVSSVRTFNLSFGGAPIKAVATGMGRFEHERRVESVVIGPAQRYVVDVRFEEPGTHALVNRVRVLSHRTGLFIPVVDTLGIVRVARASARPDLAAEFRTPRTPDGVARELAPYRKYFDDPPDHELVLALETEGMPIALEQLMRLPGTYAAPVEWGASMPMMNWLTTSAGVRWVLRDPESGRENMDIHWRFEVGDVVKIRIHNEVNPLHAMQHPIHIHGQRFLVLAKNGAPNENLAWKDTVLIPAGATVDLLLELSNPGKWMLHCHISEHLETGMMTVLTVEPRRAP